MTAAQETRSLLTEGSGVALPLAAGSVLGENSRPGFTTKETDSHRGWSAVNFQTAPGIQASLRWKGSWPHSQTWNKYAYAGNNPTTNVDPDGEDYYLLGGDACGTDNVQCDKQGYVLDQNGSRQVITDQQVLSGATGITSGLNGTTWLTTGQGTFEGQFFDNTPTSIDVNGTPGSAAAAVGTNLGIGLFNTGIDMANSFMTNLTVGQYSLNIPHVPGGLGNAAVSGQALAMLLPLAAGGEEETAEEIIAGSKKASILREFPSQFLDKTLKEIKLAKQEGVPFAAKAWKLLTDSRFNK